MFKSKAKQITDFFLAEAKCMREETWGSRGKIRAHKFDTNQLTGMAHKRRRIVTEGNLPVIAVVDNSTFEHDSRQKNPNWVHLAHAVRNFAAAACDHLGETAIQSFHDDRRIRAGGLPHYETGTDDV